MRLVAVTPNPSIDRLYELDRLRIGAVNRPRVETLVAGGKGLNVARVATALGTEVAVVALVAGHAGRWLVEAIAAEGIAGRYAWAPGETRTCLAIHDAGDDTLTELNEAGPTVSGDHWTGLLTALGQELEAGAAALVTISGSLPPGAPADGLAQLASTAARFDVPVALDAGGPALGLALETRPWLVKLNVAEARSALGEGAEATVEAAAAAATQIAARTGGAVIVTQGVEGAVAVGPDRARYRVGPPSTRGPFPVGSGDAFLAGVATATLHGGSFVDALRQGAAAAAANAHVRGAGRLDPAEVERLLPDIGIEVFGA
jgi:1-phosphofructokinase family hexose kinase